MNYTLFKKGNFVFALLLIVGTVRLHAQQVNISNDSNSTFIGHKTIPTPGTGGNISTNPLFKIDRSTHPLIQSTTTKFTYTGANQTFTVPACVTQLTVQLWGAGGGGADNFQASSGGSGGYVAGTLAVTPGSTITIIVGGGGNTNVAAATYGGGGEMGDADASDFREDASGGGRSAIQLTAGTDAVTAGGGGGAGSSDYTSGGGGATAVGVAYGGAGGGITGISSNATYSVTAASGGTQVAGGAGGTGNAGNGATGALYTGGKGGLAFGGVGNPGGAGGGGGGYYGGGGGGTDNNYYGNGGAGGSSNISNAAMSGASTITGTINTTGAGAAAPNNADANYNAGIGVGGAGVFSGASAGGNGEVVITYNAFSASISASTNPTSCSSPNGSATVTQCGGASPYMYSWAAAGYTGGATATYSGLPAGTYTCTVTDKNGLTATATVTLTQALSASLTSSTNPTTCAGTNGSVTVTASGSSGYTYNWTPTGYTGGTTTTYSNLPSGTYTCTVTDVNSCTATATVTLTGVSDGVTASITSHTNPGTCSGATGSATAAHGGGVATYTYSWAPAGYTGGTTVTYSNLPAGTYTCTITDGNGCTATATVTLLPTFTNNSLSCGPTNYTDLCGLNYAVGSQLVETRSQASGFNTGGTGLPITVSISGIPYTNCMNILKAYIYWEGSYTSGPANPATLTVTNPASTTHTYSVGQIGLAGAKCWGETGTVAYKGDVTTSVSSTNPNGTYTINISGAGNSGSEVDGATLFIIYQDQSQTYSASITLDDGVITTAATSNIAYTASGFNVCKASSTATAFALLADMQSNSNATNSETFNGSTASFSNSFWNFCSIATSVTAGQTTAAYSTYTNNTWNILTGTNDCYALVMAGMYWQNTNCISCSACTVLPIKLLSFQAEYEEMSNIVTLSWATATEMNNKLFTIERSTNGADWEKLIDITGAGNSDKQLYYSATDENPNTGVSYYRLKQTDYDGKFSYSQTEAVNIIASNHFSVFPNPASNIATVNFVSAAAGNAILIIDNAEGIEMDSKEFNTQKGGNTYQIDFSRYGNGLYFIMLNDARSNVSKIIINHN